MRLAKAKDEPIETRWPTLKAFYEGLERTLHERGISSLTTGGNACIVYGLAQMTKDCDIIIPVEKAEEVLQILAKTTLRGNRCHFTLKYGGPLHSRWLNGGWSSHTFFGPLNKPLARVDFFVKPPRVTALRHDENPHYLSRDGVARMKKTRRAKDWAFANLLGTQMVKRGDIAGILHITDPKVLADLTNETEVPVALLAERPLLKLVQDHHPDAERYLKAEIEFWTQLDDLRLTTYETAWVPYGKELEKNPKLAERSVLDQHKRLVEIADQRLDPNPLQTVGFQNLIAQAKEKTAKIFHDIDLTLLPTPVAFFGQKPAAAGQPSREFEL